MLISSWLSSVRNRLQHQTRYVKRRMLRTRAAKSAENLEIRSLLTTLVAVRPNIGAFLVDGETRNVAPQELTLQFSLGEAIDVGSISTKSILVERAGHDGEFTTSKVPVSVGYVGIGNSVNEVVLRFAENLPNDHYRITVKGTGADRLTSSGGTAFNDGNDDEFSFRLDLGAQVVGVVPQPVTTNPNGTISDTARNRIVVYFNEDDLNQASAENPGFYQLIFTNDTVSNADDSVHTPQTAVYNSANNTVTLTFASNIENLSGAGTYRLRIGNAEAPPAAPLLQTINADPGDSYGGANTSVGTISLAGNRSHLLTNAINPQTYAFTFPGANTDPGNRQIEIESHLNGGADTTPGTSQIDYNFRDVYGTDPLGNILNNVITTAQKERAREVFEFYSNLLGIDFRETDSSGLTIVTGDMRALDPTIPTGPGGVAGLAGGGMAIMDQAETWNDEAGASWFEVALHEIGHLLGLGHTYELPSQTIQGSNPAASPVPSEQQYPGNADIVHGQHLFRPDSIDIDMYRFVVGAGESGQLTAEVFAERLPNASRLDSVIRLFRENADGTRELIAQNDDYFSEDSFLQLDLTAGTYFIGVSSVGNDVYDPTIPGTGIGGTSQGAYQLRLDYRASETATIVDTTGVRFDGDADGNAGGVYNFWFRAVAPASTLFVSKTAAAGGTGSAVAPFQHIKDAVAVAVPGQVIRVVGNGGADGILSTTADNIPYQIGFNSNNQPLPDGSTLEIPQGVTLMVDAGAVFKLRRALIGVGSSSTSVDKSGGALQILGTPLQQVTFTSWTDETIGTDTSPTPTSAQPGDWGGIAFRDSVDRAQARFNYQSEGIFLNYVAHSDIRWGGGNVIVDSVLQTINPIFIDGAQPTIVHNTITRSSDSAISANPDSFEEMTFHAPRFQNGAPAFTSDYNRVGPDFYGNKLVNNSTNGVFIRVITPAGNLTQKLTVSGRFDDTDIVHVIAQNLEIQGTPGGSVRDQTPPAINLVTLTARTGGTLAAGTYNYRIAMTDENGFEGPTSVATGALTTGVAGSIELQSLPPATGAYSGRRVYRSAPGGGGPYILVGKLDKSATTFVDTGTNLGRTLTPLSERDRGRQNARLAIDAGTVVKLEGSRIETEFGAQIIAEGVVGRPVIFTSRLDDRYGAGGTFDTNNDDLAPVEAVPSPGNWGGIYVGHMGSASLDRALITFAGGIIPVGGNFAGFNAVEIHQATARIRNTVFESNASGTGGTSPANRSGLFANSAGTIFVRSAQPVILNNDFRNNAGPGISANVNALNSSLVVDVGRSTGLADRQLSYGDNQGPLVRDNRFGGNAQNGMRVRGETLTTQGVWDDTDIVHILQDEIYVPDFHHYGGLRLESSSTSSLVIKLLGANAGFTVNGYALDIDDRIGGSIQVVGQPGQPVVMTSLHDDLVGAGFDLNGLPLRDTNSNGNATTAGPGNWRGIRVLQYAHDRNVAVVVEREQADRFSQDTNGTIGTAETIGLLARDQKSGDENLRLAFEVHGFIDSITDTDIYSFNGTAGTPVWFDLDRTTKSLDSIVELLDANGNIIVISDNINDVAVTNANVNARLMPFDPFNGQDLYTLNQYDAGFRVVLPGTNGTTQPYFVRVRSRSAAPDASTVGGTTTGVYQLQIRLQELDEFPGTTISYADIRFATTGIEIIGQPAHTPLAGESTEVEPGTGPSLPATTGVSSVTVGNLMNTDRAALYLAGKLGVPYTAGGAAATTPAARASATYDVDFWEFEVRYDGIQQIAGASTVGPHIPVTIDLDFADGFSRADVTIAVYDSSNRLILIGRDSNISDDQPKPRNGADVSDLSRGSSGKLDPFIGPVELKTGTYRLAVFPNDIVPQALNQYWQANPTSSLVRFEPINSVQRIAEERFGSGTSDVRSAALAPVMDLFTVTGSTLDPKHIVPFHLGDVPLFVSQARGITGTNRSVVSMVDGFTGAHETLLGQFAAPSGDIAMRADGHLHTFSLGPSTGDFTDGNVGNYLRIDTGTAAVTSFGDDGIVTNIQNGTAAAVHDVGIGFNAMTYTAPTGNNLYAVGNRSQLSLKSGQQGFVNAQYTRNIVYNFNVATGDQINRGNGPDRIDLAQATAGAGTTQTEIGVIDTSFTNGGLNGTITGIAPLPGGNSFIAVDNAGGLYRWTPGGATGTTTFIANIGGLNINFAGLSAGPDEVEGGRYSSMFFGVSATGRLYAFNSAGVLQPVFNNAQTSVQIASVTNVTGIAFGTLEYNPWQVTGHRGSLDAADDGHGIDVAPYDDSIDLGSSKVGILGGIGVSK